MGLILAVTHGLLRQLTTLLDSMQEAIHTLRCIFWCLLMYAEHTDRSDVVSYPVHCVFAYWPFRALALQRSIFRENRTMYLPSLPVK